MKEFVEKLIERLKKNGQKMCEAKSSVPFGKHSPSNHRYYKAISVKKAVFLINQLAEEYNKKYEPTMDLIEYGVEGYNLHLKEQYRKGYEAAKAEKGWIPCSERLPEFDVWVLVTRSSGIIDLDMFKGTRWISREDSVIAWQPLPAPYQPKGE